MRLAYTEFTSAIYCDLQLTFGRAEADIIFLAIFPTEILTKYVNGEHRM